MNNQNDPMYDQTNEPDPSETGLVGASVGADTSPTGLTGPDPTTPPTPSGQGYNTGSSGVAGTSTPPDASSPGGIAGTGVGPDSSETGLAGAGGAADSGMTGLADGSTIAREDAAALDRQNQTGQNSQYAHPDQSNQGDARDASDADPANYAAGAQAMNRQPNTPPGRAAPPDQAGVLYPGADDESIQREDSTGM